MTMIETIAPPVRTGSDIAVIGGGLSGTLAACLLGRAGYSVTLIDRHRHFPPRFRAEKLGAGHIERLRRLDLLPALAGRGAAFDTVLNLREGRLLDVTHSPHLGIRYHDLVAALRAMLPETVHVVTGQASAIRTGARRQRVAIYGQEEVTARLLVLASGGGDLLRRNLDIVRRVVRPRHSIAFGFDLRLHDADRFAQAAVTCYGDHLSEGIDYLTLFPVAGGLRGNLHAYCSPADCFAKTLRDRPDETLAALFPCLAEVIGRFDVPGGIESWITDLAVAENLRRDGIVLIGDAFQTSCPAAGTGVSRLLTDVERLCQVHLPRWMRQGTVSAADLAGFYDDPEKRAMDAHALDMAEFRRGLTMGTGFSSQLGRRLHFARRRAMHMVDTLSPALAARLREISQAHLHRSP